MVIAESLLSVGISAAGVRIFVHHEMIVVADDKHDDSADEHAERSA